MTTEQENHFSMQLVSRDFLSQNTAITSTLPNFAGFFTAVQNGITQVQIIREQQEFNKTGIALNKAQLKASLISQSIDIARKMVAYATFVNNTVLLEEIGYTETSLKKSADTILKDRCQVIYDRANANVAALGTYGVTAAMLANLLTTLNSYNAAIPKPRLGITEKKQATDQLVILLKNIDDNLGKIDTLVEIVRMTQANFYNGYKIARKIVDIGGRTMAVKGKIIDKESGDGLKGATITFIGDASMDTAKAGSDLATKVKKSADLGGFYVKQLAEGSYNLKVTKQGYKDAMIKVHVTDSELCTVVIALEKV
jgi:hypothetical protein